MNYKSKLYHWVMENFETAPQMDSNASNTPGNKLPYAGADYMAGGMPVKQDIAGEELKNSIRGITTFSELKQKIDLIIKDMRAAGENCTSKDATAECFTAFLDKIQNPESLGLIEHMKQELNIKNQNKG